MLSTPSIEPVNNWFDSAATSDTELAEGGAIWNLTRNIWFMEEMFKSTNTYELKSNVNYGRRKHCKKSNNFR